MCGIGALFGLKLPLEAIQALEPMLETIRHRGPDDEGIALFNAQGPIEVPSNCVAALGHRRLSIVDLSTAGKQPLCTPDERFWISYNGEIYNYVEVRSVLKGLGHVFTTQTDTEVVLHAFQQWGTECLHRFNGMFAFVIYDAKKHTIFAARDRFGVKPLYYWTSPKGFLAFGSEIKQFTVLPGWQASLQGQCAYDYLNWGVLDHTHATLFEGVYQLRGGESLVVHLEQLSFLQKQQWYTLEHHPFQGTLKDAAQQYVELLSDSLRLRMRTDVPIGSCLSGGLDSSSLVCLMQRLSQTNETLQTFSACSDHAHFDEREYIEHIVNQTGVHPHYTTPCFEEMWSLLPTVIWHQDEPFISSSVFAQWKVFELAHSQNVAVMIDGQGADEQLAGYLGFFGNSFYDHFAAGRWGELGREIRFATQMHPQLQPWGLLLNKLVPSLIRQPLRKALGKTAAHPSWMHSKTLNVKERDPFAHERHKSVYDQSRLQLLYSNLPMLLHYEDRDSMAHSVESRTPFLDYRLVEFTLGLPNDFKISQGWTKRLLREGMKGILPEKIRLRSDKKAFGMAEEHWVRVRGSARMLQAIEETIDLTQGILDSSVKDLAEKMIEGERPYNPYLWRWMCFGQWLKRFKVKI